MLDDILQSIYSSVVEAQNTIEQHYLGEITVTQGENPADSV
jgi:hypothetical protein